MEWKFKKNEKANRIILLVLCGVLLLVLTIPAGSSKSDQTQTETESSGVNSCEERLRQMLSDSYGEGMVDVMVYAQETTRAYYGSSGGYEITGVLITIKKDAVQGETVADITLAVCALFDLPAHKVAVLVK